MLNWPGDPGHLCAMVMALDPHQGPDHYTALLPFKPKNMVMCHQSGTLEKAICLTEVDMVAEEAGHYLIPKSWKWKQGGGGGIMDRRIAKVGLWPSGKGSWEK